MHDDGHLDSPEVREAINGTLRDILGDDGWGRSYWDILIKNLREDFGIETDLLELAQNAPNLARTFQIGALTRHGFISAEAADAIRDIIRALLGIAFRANKGDEKALDQLAVLHKVAHPFSYDLPRTVIKSLANSYHTSPHLARAWDIRALMLELSYEVEPTSFDRSVADGPIRATTRDLHTVNRNLLKEAEPHIRKGTTLQSLAIEIYMQRLASEGINVELRQIRADLRKLKEWEAVNLKDAPYTLSLWERAGEYPGASIPAIPMYSDGWKKLWRRGAKKTK